MSYNEIDLGFAKLIIYTSELGIENAMIRMEGDARPHDFNISPEKIYSEEIIE
jgi:hypothetical protein|tara:strand:+ start:326 stop:484 length:159 start_codon:yes stop_codon:yes gene_type:complete